MPITVVVNGEACTVPEDQTISGLLAQLNIDPERVAVELDRRIVKQPHWSTTMLEADARIEIVQFVGGG